jgi:hypothetical protein
MKLLDDLICLFWIMVLAAGMLYIYTHIIDWVNLLWNI